MKKKEFLNEAKRKAIIADKEKAIIESFAKTFNKIKRINENELTEDLTLQYADRPTSTSPILEIGYDDDGILHKFGFNFREDEEIPLSELISGIQRANQGLQNAIQGGSDLGAFDFQREIKLLQKLAETDKKYKDMIDFIGTSPRDGGLISSSMSKIGPVLNINMSNYHDAITDCKITIQMYQGIIDLLKKYQDVDIMKYQTERIKVIRNK